MWKNLHYASIVCYYSVLLYCIIARKSRTCHCMLTYMWWWVRLYFRGVLYVIFKKSKSNNLNLGRILRRYSAENNLIWQFFIVACCNKLTIKYGIHFPYFSLNRIRYLLLGRMLRLTRILLQVRRFRAFVATFFTLMSSLLPYLGIVFCILCVYCSIGLQVLILLCFCIVLCLN